MWPCLSSGPSLYSTFKPSQSPTFFLCCHASPLYPPTLILFLVSVCPSTLLSCFFSCYDKTRDRNDGWRGRLFGLLISVDTSQWVWPRNWAGSDCRNLWHGLFESWRIGKWRELDCNQDQPIQRKAFQLVPPPPLARPYLQKHSESL